MDDRIKKVLDYIEDDLSKQFSLNDLASFACLSPSQFHRVFKAETKRTPHRFIEEIKMKTAYQEITNKDVSILDLSLKLGYNNYETLTRAFKKYYHFSPDDLKSIVNNIKGNAEMSETENIIIATLDTDINEKELIENLKNIMADKNVTGLDLKDATIYKIVKIENQDHRQEGLIKNKYQISNEKKVWEQLIMAN